MSSETPDEEVAAARRNPLEVITDYLQEFDGGAQTEAYERPSAEGLLRWLRQEGWQVAPIDIVPVSRGD